jgi:MarR family transcriptional regulator, organic hydroperoxide resistance regulator
MGNDAHAITELFETASLGGPERAVGFVIWRVMHRYVRAADRALTGLGLTHLQFQTLALAAWLGRSGAPVTQVELARAGDIAPMQVSHMMKTLETKDWISRPRSTSDVRAKHVELTTVGLAVLRRALPVMIDVQREVFGTAGAPGGVLLNSLLQLEV